MWLSRRLSLCYWVCLACVSDQISLLFSAQSVPSVWAMSYQLDRFLSACRQLRYNRGINMAPPSFSDRWTPPSPSPFSPTSFCNQTSASIHFRSNKVHDLCPAWMDPWWEPLSPGIVLWATPSDWQSSHLHPPLSFCNSLWLCSVS